MMADDPPRDGPSFDDYWKPQQREPPAPQSHNVHPIGTGYAERALSGELGTVRATAQGERNDTLNVAAMKLGQLVAAGHLDEQRVIDELVQVARAVGLDEREILPTIQSGLRKGKTEPRVVTELVPPPVTVLDDPTDAAAVVADGAVDRFTLPTDWRAIWEQDNVVDWIVEPLLPARRLVALFSPPKVGKTLLALELAAAIAGGHDVLGVKVEQRRVLYLDFENDPIDDVVQRLKSMGYRPGDLDNLLHLSYPHLANLDTAMGAVDLLEYLRRHDCDVVIIDTIGRAIGGEENSNDTWLSFYRHTGLALKQAGITCLRIDHAGKDAERGMRGASAKYGDVDCVWRLTEVAHNMLRLQCTEHRLKIDENDLTLIREEHPLRHVVQADGRIAIWRQRIDETIAALDELGADPQIGRPAARALLKSAGHQPGSNDMLTQALRRWKALHNVIEMED